MRSPCLIRSVLSTRHQAADSEIEISYEAVNDGASETKFLANVDLGQPELVVLLDCAQSEAMLMEGTAREVCSNVQKLRKEAKLTPKDAIRVHLTAEADGSATKLSSVRILPYFKEYSLLVSHRLHRCWVNFWPKLVMISDRRLSETMGRRVKCSSSAWLTLERTVPRSRLALCGFSFALSGTLKYGLTHFKRITCAFVWIFARAYVGAVGQ